MPITAAGIAGYPKAGKRVAAAQLLIDADKAGLPILNPAAGEHVPVELTDSACVGRAENNTISESLANLRTRLDELESYTDGRGES